MSKGTEQRRNHPIVSYLIGAVFVALSAVVFVGIVHHLTVSSHGPQLLAPLLEMYRERHRSEILTEARRQKDLEIHQHFHHETDYPQPPEDVRPVCYICHSDFPHSKNRQIRSLLNMHTQFIVCETCHIEKPENTGVTYRWYNPMNEQPAGPFFGTHYDPASGELARVEDLISKIAPFFERAAVLEPVVQMQNAPRARDYMKVRDQLTPEQRDGVKNQFHEHIKPKGHLCEACHTAAGGVLDFKKLGFSDKRAEELRKLRLKNVLTQHKEIELPALYKK